MKIIDITRKYVGSIGAGLFGYSLPVFPWQELNVVLCVTGLVLIVISYIALEIYIKSLTRK